MFCPKKLIGRMKSMLHRIPRIVDRPSGHLSIDITSINNLKVGRPVESAAAKLA